ncbi:MAG: PIG-L family deacetylase [Lentisphaerae bacterium]|nr:PIG-L family deacetylase [Lentisphaerota bacterium]
MRTLPDSIPQTVMAMGAHADDIEIGVGGTLAKYHALGYKVVYIMSTNNMSGSVSTLEADNKRVNRKEVNTDMMARRKRECAAAAAELGTTPIHLDYPQRHYTDENLDRVDLRYDTPRPASVTGDVPCIITAGEEKEPIERMTNLILEHNPELILTSPLATYNPEHFGTTLLATNGYWEAVKRGYKGGLLYWMEPQTRYGSAYLRWETFVDISPQLDRKMELIGKHACQMPNAHLPTFGHRILTMEYGKACGCLAAECFIWCNRPSHDEGRFPAYGSLTLELYKNAR